MVSVNTLCHLKKGKSEIIHRGHGLAIMAVGNMVQEAEKIYNRYISEGDDVTFVNADS